jgi:hypothetical protein
MNCWSVSISKGTAVVYLVVHSVPSVLCFHNQEAACIFTPAAFDPYKGRSADGPLHQSVHIHDARQCQCLMKMCRWALIGPCRCVWTGRCIQDGCRQVLVVAVLSAGSCNSRTRFLNRVALPLAPGSAPTVWLLQLISRPSIGHDSRQEHAYMAKRCRALLLLLHYS